ncbi:MAG: ATP-binding cassette domain-containing protein [Candidatus Aminicenantes bacterium]|nr:ATP-binding cassette domain-containing protein [Candidatus Aminicenantes bacterium]NIM83485.1 ATP-binding cassette domain-containing protein [Candidatus Aminicenantes bacterium]NIN22877.1 ATP-binding cassette domain-containing protein [Candidatus Aminicenantes bacterium]NIN46613.1 ATP-binding cassette domain-containing protein [Candidatus Aminicenantes bacterium]NIN89516.1 ATP-binding cassette domain-containing protein [Candidatus Aminicenantes bacterium]
MSIDAIVVENARYNYGDIQAVKGITFQVAEGEIFGFLGPNGAGKSTTIKMLTGQIYPKQGKITVLGLDITKKSGKIQAQIGVCFERTNLYEQMSAIENLKLFAKLFGVKKFDADELITRVGLKGREKDRVSTFSKGMKQRLMVARSLVNKPKILFLDEPTEGLDPTSADNIRHVILEERERGATVFLTTHDMLEADKLSDRVAFINAGEIVALDTPYNLKQRYGKRAIKAQIRTENGELENREIYMDNTNTANDVHALFKNEKVVTIHSEEASLEDIFMQITGRGLTG